MRHPKSAKLMMLNYSACRPDLLIWANQRGVWFWAQSRRLCRDFAHGALTLLSLSCLSWQTGPADRQTDNRRPSMECEKETATHSTRVTLLCNQHRALGREQESGRTPRAASDPIRFPESLTHCQEAALPPPPAPGIQHPGLQRAGRECEKQQLFRCIFKTHWH